MKTFEYKGDTLAIIDGDIWAKLSLAAINTVEEQPKKRGRKRLGTLQQITRNMERKRRNRLGPDAEQTITAEISAGMGLTEACKKYDISVSTYYRLKNESRSKPVREE
jgi:DNA invertase Pin-like site-specific DNA recombinase